MPAEQVILATALARRVGEEGRQIQNQGTERGEAAPGIRAQPELRGTLLQLRVLSGIANGPDSLFRQALTDPTEEHAALRALAHNGSRIQSATASHAFQ